MKTMPWFLLMLAGTLVVTMLATAQPDSPPPVEEEMLEDILAEAVSSSELPAEPAPTNAPTPVILPAVANEPSPAPATTVAENPVVSETLPRIESKPVLLPNGEPGLRLNFRGAPLELVLNYLSEAAGFTIVPETELRGRVDVWSHQPLSRDEAVEVLNQVLAKNGYAVLREGRTLTIVKQEEARKRDIPVRSGYEPSTIPRNNEVVTQIIPVRFISATQLIKDLTPLLPLSTTMTANEGGNAIVITDTQINIRRMAEIIQALDTTVSSLSAVRVFPLRYADAKSVATVIKDVFSASSASTQSGGDRGRQFGFFRGGPFGGGDAGNAASAAGGRPGAGRVVATADERSNSLVVSAPDDLMPTIEELVASVDTSVEDVTEVRVFKLKHSDPQEMADLLTSLFPDETSTQRTGGNSRRFGGFFGSPGGGQATGETSERAKKQTRVIAAPDYRTSSVVVSASRELMFQIAGMVEQLDADPAKQQKVFVYELKNADVGNAEEIVRGLFEGQNTRRTTTSQTRSALETREAQTQNQPTTTGFGTSGSSRGGGQTFR